MKKIIFKKISVRNFLSIGSKEIVLDFTPGINLITGINLDKEDASNGTGKCVDPSTEVEIKISNPMVLERFKRFCNKK